MHPINSDSVFANKQDLPHALTVADLTEKLALHKITQLKWKIQACTAKTGDGIFEGLEWLSKTIANT
jgi:ADP-ribosylation factor protein 1